MLDYYFLLKGFIHLIKQESELIFYPWIHRERYLSFTNWVNNAQVTRTCRIFSQWKCPEYKKMSLNSGTFYLSNWSLNAAAFIGRNNWVRAPISESGKSNQTTWQNIETIWPVMDFSIISSSLSLSLPIAKQKWDQVTLPTSLKHALCVDL